MESNHNGIKITLNETPGGDLIYWNDSSSDMDKINQQIPSSPRKNDIVGSSSANGSHMWGGVGNSEGDNYGNNRLIDTWTFVKEIATPIVMTVCPPVSMSGKVWNDLNENGIDNGGAETGTNAGSSTMTVYLVDRTNPDSPVIIGNSAVASNGNYSFNNVPSGRNYSVILSNENTFHIGSSTLPASSLPEEYVTGELFGSNNGAGSGSDNRDGEIAVTTGSSNVTGVNFGIFKNNTTNAVNDENSTWVNTPVSGNVTLNDYDRENHTQVFQHFLSQDNGATILASGSVVSGKDAEGNPVSNAGTLTYGADGSYTYTQGFTGNISVPYQICDNQNPAACDVAYLEITVSPVITENSVIVNNDEYLNHGSNVTGNLLLNDADPQGDDLSVTTVYTYDAEGNPQTVSTGSSVTVGGVDEKGNYVPNAGTLVVNPDGTFEFIPSVDVPVTVDFEYVASDNNGSSPATDRGRVTIDVQKDKNGPQNDRPFAGDDFVYTTVNTPVDGNYAANDTDPNGNPISIKDNSGNPVLIDPSNDGSEVVTLLTVNGGTVILNNNGTFTYIPKENYTGPDYVVYEICDVTSVDPQPLCAEGIIHMLVGAKQINIEGSVWHDVNGDAEKDKSENAISGDSKHAEAGADLTEDNIFAVLVDATSNTVVKTVLVGTNGNYSFTNVSEGNYNVILVAGTAPALGTNLTSGVTPSGWLPTGTNQLVDGVPTPNTTATDNVISLGRVTENVSGVNFGLQQPPVAENSSYVLVDQPTPGVMIPLNGTVPALVGSEQTNVEGPVGADREPGSVTFKLVTPPTTVGGTSAKNPVLYYFDEDLQQPVEVNEDNFPNGIPDFDPSKLFVELSGTGYTGIEFEFIVIDEAGAESEVATYRLSWSSALPVKWESVTVKQENEQAVVTWVMAEEVNVDRYEVQHSRDGRNWVTIGSVTACNQSPARYSHSSVLSAPGVHYYRVVSVEKDGTNSISTIVSLSGGAINSLVAYPNPVTGGELFFGASTEPVASARLISLAGRTVAAASAGSVKMDVRGLPSGTYILQVVLENGQTISKPVIIK